MLKSALRQEIAIFIIKKDLNILQNIKKKGIIHLFRDEVLAKKKYYAKESVMKKVLMVVLSMFLVQVFAYAQHAMVQYSVHMSGIGWGEYAANGEMAGTTGQNRQIEAIKVRVASNVSGDIRYDVHLSGIGWTGWFFNDDEAGTTGQNRQMEAIRIRLSGELANQYDIRYQVHASVIGWTDWVMNGADAGTTGQNRRIEAIRVELVKKPVAEKAPVVAREPLINFAHVPANIVVEETSLGRTIKLLNAVYFQPDSTIMMENFRPVIEEAGEQLKADSALHITLRGYAPPFGAPEGHRIISEARANTCKNFLMQNYGIAASRIHIEFVEAGRAPEFFKDASWESFRGIELLANRR